MEVDLEDLFKYPSSRDRRRKEQECPLEFANETRAHLKRKLDFESSAAAKCSKSHSTDERQNISKLNFFEKYRYGGKKEQSKMHKTYSGTPSAVIKSTNSSTEPSQQDAYGHKRFSIGHRSPNFQRTTYSSFKKSSPGRNSDTYRSPAQSKGIRPSWTPHDKRSKKVWCIHILRILECFTKYYVKLRHVYFCRFCLLQRKAMIVKAGLSGKLQKMYRWNVSLCHPFRSCFDSPLQTVQDLCINRCFNQPHEWNFNCIFHNCKIPAKLGNKNC